MRADGPRIVIVGAGGWVFPMELVRDILSFAALRSSTIVLFDIDVPSAERTAVSARELIELGGLPARVEVAATLRDALRGADVAITVFQVGGVEGYAPDIEIPREYGIDLDKNTPDARRILEMLKRMEDEGFQFEGAEASFELLMERALGNHRPYFDLDGYRVIVEEDNGAEEPVAEATVRLRVKGIAEHTAAAGNGPVNALDHALRKALGDFYPNLREMSLLDYKVRILDESKGTGARTRVLVTSGDGNETWGTVGVADNIIEASWQALVDSIEYKLRRDERSPSSEFSMHKAIYSLRPDVHAIVHAHPPFGTGFAVANVPLDKPLLSEVILTLGCVPLTAFQWRVQT
jgi:hypothetical protein